MARLFQALVVLGGSVVGCGRAVDRLGDGAGAGDSGSPAGTGSVAMNPMGTGGVNPGGSLTGGATNTGGAGVVSPLGGAPPTAQGGAAPTAQGGVSAAGASAAQAGTGVIDIDPVLPSDGGAARGPDDCPPARWECESLTCAGSQPYCGSAWTGEIESCPEPSRTDCTCSADLAASDSECDAGEVFTCRAGWFEAASDSDAGGSEWLEYECRCVPRGASCADACDNHGVGGYQRACVDQGDLVLCGGCIYTGILR